MRVVRLQAPDDFDGWRRAARMLAAGRVPPGQLVWRVGDGPADLFADDEPSMTGPTPALHVPRAFVQMASHAILHSDPERFALLYALLLRVLDAPSLLHDRADGQMRRARALAQTVWRDIHKMQAFLRFREVEDEVGPRFVAWFEPEHHILGAAASHFVDRFANRRWSILTPKGTLHWDLHTLREGPPARRGDAPGDDPVEAAWKAYYAAIFNPGRLMTGAMLKEMPKKYWKNLPEAALVSTLVAGAGRREQDMVERSRTADPGRANHPHSDHREDKITIKTIKKE